MRQADFEAIAESIPHIVWLADADGSTDYFNRRGTDYTGLPPQANYGWGWVALVHPDDTARARFGWELATGTMTPFELTYRIRRSDGEFRWHAFRALPVRGPNGEIVKWIGTTDDLDEPAPPDDGARIERQTTQLRALLATIQPVRSEGFGFVEPEVLTARVNATLATGTGAPLARRSSGDDARWSADVAATHRLRPREVSVLRLVAAGHTNAEIANLLGVSIRSVEASRSSLRQNLGLRTRAELVRYAHEAGLAGRGA